MSEIVNMMTVDVEDYFHVSAFDGVVSRDTWDTQERRVEANTDRLLGIFADAQIRATFFVLGWVCERMPALVQRIAASGHEIASHGYGHRLVYEQTQSAFRDDIRRSKALLEHAASRAVVGYRAPSFSVTQKSLWALDVLIEEGFRYDASIFPIRHDRYGIAVSPRTPYVVQSAAGSVVEIPGSTVRLGRMNVPVAGGGYFRILPYRWTRWGMARLNRVDRQPAIFYLHPWEIDPDQPRFDMPAWRRFRHYRNLRHTEHRLRALLREFSFSSVSEVLFGNAPGAELSFPVEVPATW